MDFLSPDFLFRNALLGGLVVAVLCSTLGVYMVLRRLVLLSVALPQAGAAGIAAVFLLTRHSHAADPGSAHLLALAGSLAATLGSLALLVAAGRRTRVPDEWRIGALLALATAATYLLVSLDPQGDIEMSSLLRGEVLSIADAELVVLAAASALALLLFFLFRRELLLASFDPEFARTLGRRPERADALLYALLGGSIALGVMNVGPLVVFGFLVLPALASLRLAPSLGVAFALSIAVAAASSLGGFAVALHADLPAGPTSVAVAAAFWALAAGAGRLRRRVRARRAAVLAALAVPLLLGCAGTPDTPDAAPALLPRGTLPALDGSRPVAVLPFRNETGQRLSLGHANPLKDVQRALGDPFVPRSATVPDALAEAAASELARRGVAVLPVASVGDAIAGAPADVAAAVRAARDAGLSGPVLLGTLRRFTVTRGDLLLVRLELALVDPASETVLWRGAARRPVPVRSALTLQEVVIDASPPIFAEAFGSSWRAPGSGG